MQNLMVMFFFFVCFYLNYVLWVNLKFGIQTKLNQHNSMVVFTFSVSNKKYSFWSNCINSRFNLKFVSLTTLAISNRRYLEFRPISNFGPLEELQLLSRTFPKNQSIKFFSCVFELVCLISLFQLIFECFFLIHSMLE